MPDSDPRSSGDPLFEGDSEMSRLMRALDWERTPLGPSPQWSAELRTYVRLMLASAQPMYLAWTHDLLALYNDAYRPILGEDKHPRALAARTADIFGRDGYPGLKPAFDAVLAGGTVAFQDILVPLARHGYLEECYFDASYTPVHEGERVVGVFAAVNETTDRVLAARRTTVLAALASHLLKAKSPARVAEAVLETVELHPHDLPFAALYLRRPDGALRCAGSAGLDEAQHGAVTALLERGGTLDEQTVVHIPPLAVRPWLEPVTALMLLHLTLPEQPRPLGVLAVGLNPRRHLDDAYREFLLLLCTQVAATLYSASLTEQVHRQRLELEERARTLEAANEEMEAFSYSVSHDLRAPVRHVMGFSSVLRASLGERLDEKSGRSLRMIESAAGRMNALIDAMLDLARTSRLPLRMGWVDLGELVDRAREDLLPELMEREVRWTVGALPTVMGDRDTLQQVVVNLVSNAVKYSRGREVTRVEVWAEERAGEWAVFVRDNGVGFDPRYGDKLFGVFQRLHRQEEFEGTGVGLANVRRIVEKHGGRVWAQGRPGEGARFSFSLPSS